MWKAAVGSLMVGLSSYVDDLCNCFHIPEPSSLTWAHAVDSQAELEAADAMFYESDAGALAEDGRVIMCHFPTQTTSDLYLDELLSAGEKRKTGLKIDIKLEKLVGPIGDLLSRVKLDVPVWWNADVFGKKKMPLKALADVATKDTVLSLGYIGTSFGKAERQDVINQLTDSGLLLPASGEISCRHITFAFSARLALSCTTELVELLDALPSTSLTLWTGVNDPRGLTRAEELRLRQALPMSRVFLDIKRQTWLGWFAS
ncbi:hypothetical protein FOZ61_010969 [Perkinsus olseni]|uniref:Menorin-like domain-containing protein n=1 Tax=Perkinsus olseni TaxID=32597 RepID=A0A7J6KVC4_PEROL|nr:hypothetical protein FOZ61_010969 [Perkinsus olseni]KAF4651811.1 hypothetical protein FOL46_010052 [Perkinsus olseni]